MTKEGNPMLGHLVYFMSGGPRGNNCLGHCVTFISRPGCPVSKKLITSILEPFDKNKLLYKEHIISNWGGAG